MAINESQYLTVLNSSIPIAVANKYFDHNIFTPIPLCVEMLDQLGDFTAKQVLVLYSYEMAYLLVHKYSCNPSNVYLLGHDENYYKMYLANRLGINYCEMDWLDKNKKNMKFDVIIGNPPYQDKAGQNTLYPKFYSKSVALLNDNGYLGMITPPAIIPGLWGLKDPDGIKMPKPIAIKYIAVGDKVKTYFDKRISSEFCYFILQNITDNNQNVTVSTDSGIISAAGPIFPKVGGLKDLQLVQDILNKCFTFNCDPYAATSADHGKKAKSDPNGKDDAVESISTAGVVKTRKITWVGNHPHYNQPKVIMPMYGKTAVIDYSHKLVSASQEQTEHGKLPGHNITTVLTDSDFASENLVTILESRLQKFFNTVTNETRSPYINFLKNFVGVPLNQKYTDDSLESALGLSLKQKTWLAQNF